jgi:hypothetical protein
MSDLDLNEQSNVRATLNFLRGPMGGFVAVAKALRFDYRTVVRSATGRRDVTASMALRVARLLDASVDELLAGRYRPGACPKCGHMPSYLSQSDFTDDLTVVEDAPPTPPTEGLKLVR